MFRTQAGRLHLVDSVGKISLADVSLVEDPSEEERNDDGTFLFIFDMRGGGVGGPTNPFLGKYPKLIKHM